MITNLIFWLLVHSLYSQPDFGPKSAVEMEVVALMGKIDSSRYNDIFRTNANKINTHPIVSVNLFSKASNLTSN